MTFRECRFEISFTYTSCFPLRFIQQTSNLQYATPVLPQERKVRMSSSGARHTRSASLMSYEGDDEEGGHSYEPYEPTGRRRTVAPSSNHHSRMDKNYASFRQPPSQTQYTKSGASLKSPPPSSTANNKSSLIDDDSDDEGDPYAAAAAGAKADFPALASRARAGGGMGGGANYGMAQQGLPANTSPWGNTGPQTPATNGRVHLMPGIGYGYGLPEDDQKGQHKERRTLMPPEQPTLSASVSAGRKAPPPPRDDSTNNLYPRKDPPNQHKAPVATVDFLARLTAQIDQPDEETLMTQHAQKTLLEIQHTTGVRGGSDEADPESLVNGGGQDSSSTPKTLPEPTEGRKKVSTIFSRKIQKPLEPGAQSKRLRRPRLRQESVDVMTGLMGGNITMMDHRTHCFACGMPLVTSKSVILVVCPGCQCKFPNDKAVGGIISGASSRLQAKGKVPKEYSC